MIGFLEKYFGNGKQDVATEEEPVEDHRFTDPELIALALFGNFTIMGTQEEQTLNHQVLLEAGKRVGITEEVDKDGNRRYRLKNGEGTPGGWISRDKVLKYVAEAYAGLL